MTNSRTLRRPTAVPEARYVEHVMGMPISLALRGRHTRDGAAQAAWAAVMADLREVDLVFSTYRSDSFISRLRRGEITVSDCPPEVAEVLALGRTAQRASSSAFCVYRPGVDGWMTLDPSGIVKGWAVDRAAASLELLTDTDYCLSAGGDMTCRTVDPDGTPWRIGVEDPLNTGGIIAVIPVFTGAVATSSTAHRGQHIIDGRTGLPPEGVASVTVVARSLTWADIDATAAYAHGPEAADWLQTRCGRSGLVVWADGTTTVTGGQNGMQGQNGMHRQNGTQGQNG